MKRKTFKKIKEFIFISLMMFGIVFGGFTFLNLMFQSKLLFMVFLFVPLSILLFILIKSFGDWEFEPFRKFNWQITILICFILILIIVSIFWFQLFNDIDKKYFEFCKSKGLEQNCNSVDVCSKDCETLNQKYFKYESSSLFTSESCWCNYNNKIQQIY